MTLVLNDSIKPEAQEDILQLQQKIQEYKRGEIAEDKFKSYRLTRGVYGQRQLGVQMFRIKIPYGRLTGEQLIRIADVSEEYTNGNLHTTTRQNIQLHFVHLEDTPEMWAKLEEKGITVKEACGNTVRGITGSALAGIDPDELFDVSPYAESVFQYFLRNPVNQEMGRKNKIGFSSSDKDTGYTYFQDFGFIPRIKVVDGKEVRGFKVVIGGGLGAQPYIAPTAYEFLEEDQVIPFIEAGLRVFDRYGEREKRFKARMKFLLDEKRGLGLEGFMKLVDIERQAVPHQSYPIDRNIIGEVIIPEPKEAPKVEIKNQKKYDNWLRTNVFEQKQKGFFGIYIKLQLGNISAEKSRALVKAIDGFTADDIRVTVNQGLLLRYARQEYLPYLFDALDQIGLAEPGFGTIADVTACPGTDTCNLGVTNSTGAALEIEKLLAEEYPHLLEETDIDIKISGCMNACGQHMAAAIGFHGSSIKHGDLVVPALQVVLGGGVDRTGKGLMGEKVVKLPTKKVLDAIRLILNDYEENSLEGEYFNAYYQRVGKMHFYGMLKPLADLNNLDTSDYVDWGHTESFIPEIGVGECAGVMYDVIGVILNDAEEKLFYAKKALDKEKFADAIYHSYSAFIVGAKALLLGKDVLCNTHIGIINDFNTHFVQTGEFSLPQEFDSWVLRINKNRPEAGFATNYLKDAEAFIQDVIAYRKQQLEQTKTTKDKEVIREFYKA